MEYKESSLTQFLSQNETIVQRSYPGTSPQNGHAERKYRCILDTVRAFLISSFCPKSFWGEAALTVVYTINRIPSLVIGNVSPFELIVLQTIKCLKFLVVLVLFFFILMSTQN